MYKKNLSSIKVNFLKEPKTSKTINSNQSINGWNLNTSINFFVGYS